MSFPFFRKMTEVTSHCFDRTELYHSFQIVQKSVKKGLDTSFACTGTFEPAKTETFRKTPFEGTEKIAGGKHHKNRDTPYLRLDYPPLEYPLLPTVYLFYLTILLHLSILYRVFSQKIEARAFRKSILS